MTPASTFPRASERALDPRGAVLVVYPFCLDHVGHGNIQRILSLSQHLAAAGFGVDLVYQGNPRISPATEQYRTFRRVHRVLSGTRSTGEERCRERVAALYSGFEAPGRHLVPSAALTELTRALIEAEPYQAVVATYAWTAPIFADLGRPMLRVCDVQDIMHEHAARCLEATGQPTNFSLPADTERHLWRQWEALLAITPDDERAIRQAVLPAQHLLPVRHASSRFARVCAPGSDDVALYAASDNASNVQAVVWLLEHVWPRVRASRPEARLRVAGLICRAIPEHLLSTPGLEVVGFLDDVSQEIAACGVLVAPYLYGSGLKIKVVEGACAGKAMVTTHAGVIGTDLPCGHAVEVQDDPAAFAEATARLLGNLAHREALARTALEQARRLFSADSCYGPVVDLIRLRGLTPPTSASQALDPAIVDRIDAVCDRVTPARRIAWGNGAHTRALVGALSTGPWPIDLIVDGRAATPSVSAEGLSVMPAHALVPQADDLIILSSESFEEEMWTATKPYREAGGYVLGLYDPHKVSAGIARRLSPAVQVRLGLSSFVRPSSGHAPRLVLWDSEVDAAQWWRACLIQDLAEAAARRQWHPALAVSSASRLRVFEDLADDVTFAPVLAIAGPSVLPVALDGDARHLARLGHLATEACDRAASLLQMGPDDVLVVLSPSLAEIQALARALRGRCPALVLYGLEPELERQRTVLPEGDVDAYYRLALGELADTAGGRLIAIGSSDATCARHAEALGFPVHRVAHPVNVHGAQRHPGDTRRVLCFGSVLDAHTTRLLAALAEAIGSEDWPASTTLSWRSLQSAAEKTATWQFDIASHHGIELLDDVSPQELRIRLVGADAVVVLGEVPRAAWFESLAAHVAAAGVPLLRPRNSRTDHRVAGHVAGDTFERGHAEALVLLLRDTLTRGPAVGGPHEERRDGRAAADDLLSTVLTLLADRTVPHAPDVPREALSPVPS